MLSQLLRMVSDPDRYGPRLLLRLSLIVAGVGLLWTVLVGGVLYGFISFDVWLAPRFGAAAALALTSAAGLLAASTGLLLLRRRQVQSSARPRFDLKLLQQYPLESVAVATAAGVLLSGVDGTTLARAVFDHLTEHSRDHSR